MNMVLREAAPPVILEAAGGSLDVFDSVVRETAQRETFRNVGRTFQKLDGVRQRLRETRINAYRALEQVTQFERLDEAIGEIHRLQKAKQAWMAAETQMLDGRIGTRNALDARFQLQRSMNFAQPEEGVETQTWKPYEQFGIRVPEDDSEALRSVRLRKLTTLLEAKPQRRSGPSQRKLRREQIDNERIITTMLHQCVAAGDPLEAFDVCYANERFTSNEYPVLKARLKALIAAASARAERMAQAKKRQGWMLDRVPKGGVWLKGGVAKPDEVKKKKSDEDDAKGKKKGKKKPRQ